jgi:formylglycine-generating enzyme required for sulfatase activity
MKKHLTFILLMVLATITCYAQNEKCIALVIGNSKYEGKGNTLRNPANDALDISAKLKDMDFEVITLLNGSLLQMDDVIDNFGKKAKDYDIALFYYAGHGIQSNGDNFLIPVDAVLRSEADIKYRCTNVNYVLDKLDESECPMKIIVLDACRDNPFERSWHRAAGSSGLSFINAPKGTLISYATSPGSVAEDGNGRNSPYATAFINTLDIPGLTLLSFFNKISTAVQTATNEVQIPWTTNSAITGDFCFNKGNTPTTKNPKSSQTNISVPEQKEQIDRLLREAQNNYDIAMNYIREGDYGKAIPHLKEAANLGNDEAQNTLGDLYFEGLGVDQNYHSAVSYYLQAANAGNSVAQFNMGRMYEYGYGVKPNVETSLGWYHQSSLQGYKPASDSWMRLYDFINTPSAQHTNLEFKVKGASFTMIFVEGGTFLMGAQSDNSEWNNYDRDALGDEKPIHTVVLNNYYIGETEVTVSLWNAVMGTHLESNDHPVNRITYDEALTFIQKLNQLTSRHFRLPTEAEWEYAAKGGKNSHGYIYSGSNNLSDVTLHYSEFIIGVYPDVNGQIEDVKQAAANELGIYDMTGNVLEWCSDWYGKYSEATQVNPTGPDSGTLRIARGGDYSSMPSHCRVTYRSTYNPIAPLGFRLVLTE